MASIHGCPPQFLNLSGGLGRLGRSNSNRFSFGFRFYIAMKAKRPIILSKFKLSKYWTQKLKTYHFVGQYFVKKIIHNVGSRLPFMSQWYTKHFPAVQLRQQLSPLEYGLNFSSEILVAMLVLVIAGLNLIIFNPFSSTYAHQDKSLAAQFLRYHTDLNNQLAMKHNMVSTTIESKNGFISQAFADDEGSVLGVSTTAGEEGTEDGIEDNGIEKANPDTVQKLVSRQVQIYETKPFDTVYTVAAQFGVSTKTIRDSNGLPNNALKAGWFLVIPPVDGIVVKVESDLSLYDISQKYRADMEKVMSYNGLDGPDAEIAMGDYLIIPDGVLPEAPAPAPAASGTVAKASRPSVPKAAFVGSNKFAAGNCTAYVASKVRVYWRGNASAWASNAKRAGATVNRTPSVGAIIQTNESRYGHVGYIEGVSGSKVTFSEWNYAGLFVKTTRTLDMSDSRVKAIIHP
jgi:surface antigen